jgi:hypothetical protein
MPPINQYTCCVDDLIAYIQEHQGDIITAVTMFQAAQAAAYVSNI